LEKYKRIEDLVAFIVERYDIAAEIGVGHFPDVALGLQKSGVKVFATDIRPFLYKGVDVLVDDITTPNLALYKGIDLIYSMRPPPELVPYMARLAKTISADVIIKPLSSEYPEGWKLMKNGNTTFFIINNCHVPSFNLESVIPACLESFFSDPSHLLMQKERCWTSQHDMKKVLQNEKRITKKEGFREKDHLSCR
jgi:uncharacterized protein